MLSSIKKITRKFIWNIIGEYEPREFWDNWSKTFMDDPWQRKILPQHYWALKIIKKEKPKKILEVGCGFGRNIKFLIENGVKVESITGVDISSGMIRKAKSYIENDKVKLLEADCLNLLFTDKEFDLVLVHAVFMHVRPTDIQKAVKEVKRISKKHIVVIEQNYLPKEGDQSHKYTFVHNYERLFKDENLKIVDFVKEGRFGYYYFFLEV